MMIAHDAPLPGRSANVHRAGHEAGAGQGRS
jgi:hypothetical protein